MRRARLFEIATSVKLTSYTAIIVGEESHVVVPIARSLSKHGIRCLVAVPCGESFAIRSRAISDIVQLPGLRAEAATFLGLLANAHNVAWVAAASDAGLAILAEGYTTLSAICGLSCPGPDVVAQILNRSATLAAANACGLATSNRPVDSYVADDRVTCVSLLMSDGKPQAIFQHRCVIRRGRAIQSESISEAPNPALVERTASLLRHLEWTGVAMVEFRNDRPDLGPVINRVTGRFWNSIALPISLGIDFPRYAWEISRGEHPLPPATYRAGNTLGLVPLWKFNDPMPAIQQVAAPITDAVAASAGRAGDAIRTASRLGGYRGLRYIVRQLRRRTGLEQEQRLPPNIASVLFVCHANLIRSPAAAQFLRDELRNSANSQIAVASAGTNARNDCAADQRVQRVVRELGSSIELHRSQILTNEIVNQADVIVAMDDLNVVLIEESFPQARGKVRLLGGINDSGVWRAREIADPNTASDADLARTLSEIQRFVKALHAALTRTDR